MSAARQVPPAPIRRTTSPDLLRWLDRTLGVPACWLLSGLARLHRTTRGTPKGMPHPPRRVLVVQLAESGSMVLADPAIRWLAGQGCDVYCLTLARNAPSLAITGAIPPERVLTLGAGGRQFVADLLALPARLRAIGIDAIADLELFTRCSALIGWWSGIDCRAGFHSQAGEGLYRGSLFSHPVRFRPDRHMAENYLAVVRALWPAETLSPPRVPLQVTPRIVDTPARQRVARVVAAALPATVGAPLILINANASALLPQRRWPAASFVALIRALLASHPTAAVLLVGGAEDAADNATIVAAVGDARCGDLAGCLALADLPALFAAAAVMVSNDSGPAHFAAATDLPVVTLFGPETPTLYRPLGPGSVISAGLPCSPCVRANNQRRTRCRDNRCMQAISVETVLAAALAVMQDRCALPCHPAPDTAAANAAGALPAAPARLRA